VRARVRRTRCCAGRSPGFCAKLWGVRYGGARAGSVCLRLHACAHSCWPAVAASGTRHSGGGCTARAERRACFFFPNLCMRWARWRAGLLLAAVRMACALRWLPARASPARRNQPTSLRGQKACAGWCAHARSRACVCPRPSWVAMRCVCVSTHNSGARSIECGVWHSPARGDPQSASQPGRQHQHHDSKVLLLLLASVACLPVHRYDVPGLLRALHLLGVNCAPLPGVSAVARCARVRVTRARARWLLRRDSPGTPQVTLAGVGRSSPAPRRSAARDQAHQWTRRWGQALPT
jgi:hypothetical protein